MKHEFLNKEQIKNRINKLDKIKLIYGLDTWEHNEWVRLRVMLRKNK